MWIIELTDLLTTGQPNYYVFNPSVMYLKENIYLIAYRVISYDIPMQYHPWKIWDNGYKFFPIRPHAKYRNNLGPALARELKSCPLVQTGPEVDTTALAVATFDGKKFTIRHNICDLFPNEMNQDARLVLCEGIYSIIYNVFEDGGIKLRCRDFTIEIAGDFSGQIMFSPERYLFDHKYRNVEKHCAFNHFRNQIMYSMGAAQETIVDGKMQTRRVKCFDYLFDKFDRDILISVSTSLVKYKTGFIGCGHAKILYKKTPPEMLKFVDMTKIHAHGKYIYYMYLYETNSDGHILRASPMFIPTTNDCHLPYLLAMPISMTMINNKYLISYGEGDCKCKCLILSQDEIAYMLMQTSMPCFLTEKINVNHVGYWGKFNCGDDAFMDVFKHLYRQSPHSATFAETYSENVHINVLGGGDVINDYFAKPPIPVNSIAVSVGIPYEEFVPRLKHFRAVYLRNEADNARLAKKFHTNYAPDLAFLMPRVYGMHPSGPVYKYNRPVGSCGKYSGKSIGIILARTYYNRDFPNLYEDFCRQVAQFCELARADGFHIVFIPFCINTRKPGEDDNIIIRDVAARLGFIPEVFKAGQNYVKDTYFKIAQMDFNICSRFHSHIFSTIHNVPFISLTCGRKCIEYMRIMPDCLYRLKANDVDLPIEFDGRQFYNFFKSKWWERRTIADRLQFISAELTRLADVFARDYFKILRKHSRGASITFWPSETMGSSPPFVGQYDDPTTLKPDVNPNIIPKDNIFDEPLCGMPREPTRSMQPVSMQMAPASPMQMMQPVPMQMAPASPMQMMQPVQMVPVQMAPASPMQMVPVQMQPVSMQPVSMQPVSMQPVSMQQIQPQKMVVPMANIEPIQQNIMQQMQPVIMYSMQQMQPVSMQPVIMYSMQQMQQMQPVHSVQSATQPLYYPQPLQSIFIDSSMNSVEQNILNITSATSPPW